MHHFFWDTLYIWSKKNLKRGGWFLGGRSFICNNISDLILFRCGEAPRQEARPTWLLFFTSYLNIFRQGITFTSDDRRGPLLAIIMISQLPIKYFMLILWICIQCHMWPCQMLNEMNMGHWLKNTILGLTRKSRMQLLELGPFGGD